jgi:hypothetical protein
MSRTRTMPPNDPAMRRKLKALAHPDNGGTHDLFIWTTNLLDLAEEPRRCSKACTAQPAAQPTPNAGRKSEPDRILWTGVYSFEEVTRTALRYASTGAPYGPLLSFLADCRPMDDKALQQGRGASYKQLAAIGHACGMSKSERAAWYRIAEDLALTDRHAGHILGRLKRRG